jgi:hypothetical protein
MTTLSSVVGAVAGLGTATTIGLLAPPDGNDLALAAGVGGNAALLGTLLAFTVVPVGDGVVFERILRQDFGFGVGMLTGGAATLAALAASPLLDVSAGRTLATSAGGVVGASVGVGLGFLFVPVAVERPIHRERIAFGAGAVLHLLGSGLAFFLVPQSWTDVLAQADVPVGREAVVFEDGKFKLGVPAVQLMAVGETGRLGMGIGLFGGSF